MCDRGVGDVKIETHAKLQQNILSMVNAKG